MKIGIVDDDSSVLELLVDQLEYEEVLTTTDPDKALDWIETAGIDCLVTDLKLGQKSGLELLRKARESSDPIEVIMMTGFGSVDSAVEAMKEGARDYLQKPVGVEKLQLVLERIEEEITTRTRLEGFRVATEAGEDSLLIGESDPICSLRDQIIKIASESINVLIQGETGTGKELVAREIHQSGPRADAPLITVNCAAIPENLLESELFGHVKGAFTGADEPRKGKIELADGGTVFLDEIGEMPRQLQPKLLRVLEQGQITRIGGEVPHDVDVRFVSATNQDLSQMMEADEFRKDLYYRLQTIELTTPPLRDHPEDIPQLVRHFLSKMAGEKFRELECTSEVYDVLKKYHWPGNVRELRNVIERAAVLTENNLIDRDNLPPELFGGTNNQSSRGKWWEEYGSDLGEIMKKIEMEIIERVLEETEDNKAEAARQLGISRQNLHYKLKDD